MFSRIKYYVRYSMAFILIPGVCPIYSAIWLVGRIFIKPFSETRFITFHNVLYASYQKYLVFFFEYFSGTQVIVYGDYKKVFERSEKIIYFSNHQCLLDWISMAMLAERQDSSKYTRFILKDSLKHIPFYGFHFRQHGYIYIKRGGGFQKDNFTQQIQQYCHSNYPHWLVLYPEGHRYDPTKVQTIQKVNKYAIDHGLPTYTHLLTPRTKALNLCLLSLHPHSIDAVYDVTIAFSSTLPPTKPQPSKTTTKSPDSMTTSEPLQTPDSSKSPPFPTIPPSSSIPPSDKSSSTDGGEFPSFPNRLRSPSYCDLYKGNLKIHMHISRIPASEIPADEEKLQKWLFHRYQLKDRLLSNFYSSDPSIRGRLGNDGVPSPLNLTRVLPYVIFYNATLLLALTSWQSMKLYVSSFVVLGAGTCLVASLKY